MAENTSSVTPIELTGKTTIEKVKEITEKLEQGIKELFDSDRYKEYLTTMSKFHNYSFRNTMLILFQKPDASLIAGYGAWQKNFKRQVKKGERGIKILAPAPYKKTVEEKQFDKNGVPMKDKDGNVIVNTREITVPAFKVTTVFDVSQTAGEEIPMLAKQLTGSIDEYEKFFRVLKEISPVPITLEPIDGTANGYYHLEEKRIAIKDKLSEMQTIKTAIHEIAHAKLHALPDKDKDSVTDDTRPNNRTREVQAESIAYTVCQHFGIDTSDYSFGYIAGWSSGKETEELKTSLEVIRNTATEFISVIEEKLQELTQDRENPLDKLPETSQKEDCNAPTVAELEEKAKSGEAISLLDLANAAKVEKAVKQKTAKKPSIRKQLAKDKAPNEPKLKVKSKKKSQDLEV